MARAFRPAGVDERRMFTRAPQEPWETLRPPLKDTRARRTERNSLPALPGNACAWRRANETACERYRGNEGDEVMRDGRRESEIPTVPVKLANPLQGSQWRERGDGTSNRWRER